MKEIIHIEEKEGRKIVEAMRQKGIIVNINDKDLAPLLNNKIKGLNLASDGRTLRNLNTTSYNKYYSDLLNLLP